MKAAVFHLAQKGTASPQVSPECACEWECVCTRGCWGGWGRGAVLGDRLDLSQEDRQSPPLPTASGPSSSPGPFSSVTTLAPHHPARQVGQGKYPHFAKVETEAQKGQGNGGSCQATNDRLCSFLPVWMGQERGYWMQQGVTQGGVCGRLPQPGGGRGQDGPGVTPPSQT